MTNCNWCGTRLDEKYKVGSNDYRIGFCSNKCKHEHIKKLGEIPVVGEPDSIFEVIINFLLWPFVAAFTLILWVIGSFWGQILLWLIIFVVCELIFGRLGWFGN
jgi:hypothetical protein